MYYYDETGEMQWADDAETASRHHVLTMLTARRYALSPNSIGKLHEMLGPAPINIRREEALARIRSVLNTLGLNNLTIEDTVSALNHDWQLAVQIGK